MPAPPPDYSWPSAGEAASAASSHRLTRFLAFLQKWWWLPVVTWLVGGGAGVAYVLLKNPTFVSRGQMWETLKLRLPEGGLFTDEGQNAVGTQAGVLQSATLRELALARMRANTNGAAAIALGKDRQPLPVNIRVSGAAKSSVFSIEANSANPAYTQVYLDALMESYLEYRKNVRKVISGDTLASISEQVQRWERDLKIEQEALTAFQRTNNFAILQEEGTIAAGYLAKLKTQLSDLQLEMRLLDASVLTTDQPSSATNGLQAEAILPVTAAPQPGGEKQTGFQELELLKMQRAKLSQSLRPKHPKIVKLDAEIERAQKLQEIFSQQSRDQLAASRQANLLRIQNLQATIKEWEAKVVAANARIAEAERLKLNVHRIQSVYDRLVLLVQNVGISRNIDQETLAILEPASPVKRSYSSEKSGFVLANLAGLGLGLAMVFVIAVRDDRFLSVAEANRKLGDSVVALLPEVAGTKGETSQPLLAPDDPRHFYAEAYRSLRSALLFQDSAGEHPKVLLVTSATPNEGKSTIATNLARTLALGGARVLLVDADLRKGHLHDLLGLAEEAGLIDVLQGKYPSQALVQTGALPNFYFLARGRFAGNPGDLFLDSALDEIITGWRRDYDYVVIDSSPIFAADDASCLAAKADGTLFVVRNQHSSARVVQEALDALTQRRARILGLVYNGASARTGSYQYYKYPDYYAAGKAVSA